MTSHAAKLRALLSEDTCHIMPCCWDGLSAKMIADAGFGFTFMSGFAVSASRIGLPDTGLISFGEMLDQGRNICAATPIPVIGDGDTGYGNALNVRRTVEMYARAGFASVMIEDQVAPKRCGHTKGKLVVDRDEAFNRIKAAVDAREAGADIMILARTDARHGHGLEGGHRPGQGLYRSRCGHPVRRGSTEQSEEMAQTDAARHRAFTWRTWSRAAPRRSSQAMKLHELGYNFAAYPLTLLSAAMRAMAEALRDFKQEKHPGNLLLEFEELRRIVGFRGLLYAPSQDYSDNRG